MNLDCTPASAAAAPWPELTPIERALDRIRPFLRREGGDIQIVGLAERRVRLKLVGDCPSQHLAVRRVSDDIERYLRDQVPGLDGVDLT
jgi:Fe-S cluster biogenesis protein NfuA